MRAGRDQVGLGDALRCRTARRVVGATVSSSRSAVPASSSAPAVSSVGSRPGELTLPGVGPSLPAAVTTVTPCRHSASSAWVSGSTWYGSGLPEDSDRLSTRMSSASALAETTCRPRSTVISEVLPSSAATRTSSSRASGAAPWYRPPEARAVAGDQAGDEGAVAVAVSRVRCGARGCR